MSPDVLQLQVLLAQLGHQPGPLDGDRGPKTNAAITAAAAHLDQDLAGMSASAIAVQLADVRASQRHLIPTLTLEQLQTFAPRFRPDWLAGLNLFLIEAHITADRLAPTLAQLAHESGGLFYDAEIGGPSKRYAPWYGRGPIQLTWKENYAAAGKYLGLSLTADPDVVRSSPLIGWLTVVWYWLNTGLNHHADACLIPGNEEAGFLALTKAINGGFNGLKDRQHWWERASSLFRPGGGPQPAPSPPPRTTPTPRGLPVASPPPPPASEDTMSTTPSPAHTAGLPALTGG